MALIRNDDELESYLSGKFHLGKRLMGVLLRTSPKWVGNYPISSCDVTRKLDMGNGRTKYRIRALPGMGTALFKQLLDATKPFNGEFALLDTELMKKYQRDALEGGYDRLTIVFGSHCSIGMVFPVHSKVSMVRTERKDGYKYLTHIDIMGSGTETEIRHDGWSVTFEKDSGNEDTGNK